MATDQQCQYGWAKRPHQQINMSSPYMKGADLRLAIDCSQGGGETVPHDLSGYGKSVDIVMTGCTWVATPNGWGLSIGSGATDGLSISAAQSTHLVCAPGQSQVIFVRWNSGDALAHKTLYDKGLWNSSGYRCLMASGGGGYHETWNSGSNNVWFHNPAFTADQWNSTCWSFNNTTGLGKAFSQFHYATIGEYASGYSNGFNMADNTNWPLRIGWGDYIDDFILSEIRIWIMDHKPHLDDVTNWYQLHAGQS